MSELEQIQKDISDVKVDIAEIKTALKGYDGQVGLCKQVERNIKHIRKLTIAVILIAVTLGGGAWGAIQQILGG